MKITEREAGYWMAACIIVAVDAVRAGDLELACFAAEWGRDWSCYVPD